MANKAVAGIKNVVSPQYDPAEVAGIVRGAAIRNTPPNDGPAPKTSVLPPEFETKVTDPKQAGERKMFDPRDPKVQAEAKEFTKAQMGLNPEILKESRRITNEKNAGREKSPNSLGRN